MDADCRMTQSILFVLILSVMLLGCSEESPDTMHIDLANAQIVFKGTIYPNRYNSYSDRANGHHFIVWSGGGNALKALINTDAPDDQILAGLEALGAIPGNNLSQATWDERSNSASTASDQTVQGTPVEIFVQWDQEWIPAYKLFVDSNEDDCAFRFGGHADLIPIWHSGCVTCLFSCPGGKTGNAAYTIRDQAQNRRTFVANESILPKDNTPVKIIIKPRFEDHQPFQAPSSDSSG